MMKLSKSLAIFAAGAAALGGALAYGASSYAGTAAKPGGTATGVHLLGFLSGRLGDAVLGGTGLPNNAVGTTGDFYLDTTRGVLFGPKTLGHLHPWGAGRSLIGARGAPGPRGPQGARGPAGPAGPKGTPGTSILSGSTPPTTQGSTGDFYLDTSTVSLYGPKTFGRWPAAGTSLVGPPGLVWKGTYSPVATYTRGDAVSETGSSYVSLTTRNVGRPTTTTSSWALLAAKGAAGATTTSPATQTVLVDRATFSVAGAASTTNPGVGSGVAACPAGYAVTGGGYTSSVDQVHAAQNDGPVLAGTTWEWGVSVTNATAKSATVTVYAICAKGAGHFT
jgi:hypothetical protein